MKKAKVIISASTKGGTGKTTSIVNLAYILSLKSKVLVIDTDLNRSASLCLCGLFEGVEFEKDILDFFAGNNPRKSLYKSGKLTLMPSNSEIYLNCSGENAEKMIIAVEAFREEYDYIFIDLHCNVTDLSVASISIADFAVIPVCSSDPLALAGALEQENILGQFNDRIAYRFLLSRHQKSPVSQQMLSYFKKERKGAAFATPLRESRFAQRASGLGIPVCLKYENSTISKDLYKVAKELKKILSRKGNK